VFLHGLAGDIFAGKNSEESLIASDLAENIGWAIKEISS
jgi:NAD(P)H-hydrate epimerase